MDKKQFIANMMMVKTYFPNFSLIGDKENNEALKLWYDKFKNEDSEILSQAIQIYADMKSFPPTVADLKGEIAKLILPNNDGEYHWGLIMALVRGKGSRATGDDIRELPDKALLTLRNLGGYSMVCATPLDRLSFTRTAFLKTYNNEHDEKVRLIRIEGSESVKQIPKPTPEEHKQLSKYIGKI